MNKTFKKKVLFYIVFLAWTFFGLNINVKASELKIRLEDLNPAFVEYVKNIKNGDDQNNSDKNFLV